MTLDLLCKCSHRASEHVHGDDGKECKPACGCTRFRRAVRPEARDESTETSATTDEVA